MKTASLLVMFLGIGFLPSLRALEDSPYQQSRHRLADRFYRLETERSDHRRQDPRLSPEQEKEYQRLLGEMLLMNPIWALLREIEADLVALLQQPAPDGGDAALVEEQKTIMALTASMQEQAKDLAEAQKHADTLRRFIVRRDIKGMSVWIRSFP